MSESGRFRPVSITGGVRVIYESTWPGLPIDPLQIDSVVAALARGKPKPKLVRLVERADMDRQRNCFQESAAATSLLRGC